MTDEWTFIVLPWRQWQGSGSLPSDLMDWVSLRVDLSSRRIPPLTLLRSPVSSPTSSGRPDRPLVCLVPLARLDLPQLTTCQSALLVPRLPTDAFSSLAVTKLFLRPLAAVSTSTQMPRSGERCLKVSSPQKTCRAEVHGGRKPLAYSWGHLQNSSYHHH